MKINRIIVIFLVVFNSLLASATSFDFVPAPPPPPSNDECSNAIPLTVGTACSMTQYTNASATASSGIPAPGCASYSGGDVWFTAVVPASGRLIIDSQTGGITDGGMAIYSGTCGSLTLIECDDDDSDNGLMPKIDRSGLTPGATIYIRMWEYGNDNNGTFSICAYTIETTDASTCAGADPFCTGTGLLFPASVDAPDGEAGPDYGCLCTQPNPVWYYLRIANPGSLTINISSTCGDVDYAAWGPFPGITCSSSDLTSTGTSCTTTPYSAPAGNMVDCSFSTSATESLSIPSALTGQYYMVMITNYANCSGTIHFNQTSGSGSTDCAIIAPPVTNNGPLCVGQTLNLTVTSPVTGATYAWTGPNGFTSSTMNPSISNVTVANAGVYSLVITVGGSSSAPVTTTVVVNSSPTPTAGSNCPICAGGSLNLTSSGGTSYSWSGPNSFTSTAQNPTIASATTLASGTYTVTVTATGGCTATAQVTVAVNAMPIPVASNNSPICVGTALNLASSGGTSYSWSGPNSFASTDQNPTIASATTLASGTYTVTVTATGGCTATAQTTVVVNTQPAGTIGSNSPICAGSSLNLTSSGGTSYSWSGPNSFTSTAQNPTIASATTLASGTYTVTVTATGGCTMSIQTTVTVNAMPVPVASNNGPLCAGNTLNLTASGGTSYSWSGPNGFTSTAQNPSITSVTASTAGVYTVTVTTGLCSATTQTTVVVNGSISVVPTSNSPVCENQTLNLTTTAVGNSYSWSGPNSFTSAIQSPVISPVTTLASGIYSVTVTTAAGCSGTGTVGVVVNPLPVVQITGDSTICSGQSTVLTASGGTNYNWSNTLAFAAITVSPSIQTTYIVTVTGPGGCTSTASRTVFINPNPQIDNILVTNDNCNSGIGKATASVSNGTIPYQYNWSNGIGNTPNDSLLIAGVYSVTVSDLNGCSTSQSFSVLNNPGPELSVTNIFDDHCNKGIGMATVIVNNIPGNYTYSWLTTPPQDGITASGLVAGTYVAQVTDGVCSNTLTVTISNLPGPTAKFTANPLSSNTTNAIIHFINQSEGAEAYAWDFDDSGNSLQMDPVHQYINSGTYHVILEVTDAFGCTDTTSEDILIYDDYNLFIPTAFTPNGDGLNDVFKPYGRGVNLKMKYDMHIYDRWGRQVYYTHRFENGWDGKINGAKIKSNGVFTYYISIYDNANQQHLYKGTFTVMGSKEDEDF